MYFISTLYFTWTCAFRPTPSRALSSLFDLQVPDAEYKLDRCLNASTRQAQRVCWEMNGTAAFSLIAGRVTGVLSRGYLLDWQVIKALSQAVEGINIHLQQREDVLEVKAHY